VSDYGCNPVYQDYYEFTLNPGVGQGSNGRLAFVFPSSDSVASVFVASYASKPGVFRLPRRIVGLPNGIYIRNRYEIQSQTVCKCRN